jgi:pseudouridine kinase
LSAHVLRTSNPGVITTTAGGVARNIAHNLGMLKADVSLITALGSDINGDLLLHKTQKAHVDTSKIIRISEPTGTYVAMLGEQGELITAASDMRLLQKITKTIIIRNKGEIEAADYIVADCNLNDEALDEIAAQAASKLIIEPVSVAKSKKLLRLLEKHKIYLATPNLDQIEALTGTREIEGAAKHLHALGLQNIVIHAGKQGAYVSNGANIIHVPSQAKQVIDVTGAGDAATAGLVWGLTQNLSLEKSAIFGQEMAARVISSTASTLE